MDWIALKKKATGVVGKYRYVLLVLILGLGLMCLPDRQEIQETPEQESSVQSPSLAQQLEEILSNLEGAGRVKVLLTIESGEETQYQTDVQSDSSGQSTSNRQETVLIKDDSRGESGLVRVVNGPVYQGAVVLCQGADRPSIRLALAEAVANATGLGIDRITVLKMK